MEGTPHLLKWSGDGSRAAVVGEVLASRLLELLLPPGDFARYELVARGGAAYSSSPLFVKEGADLLAIPAVASLEAGMVPNEAGMRSRWAILGRMLDGIGVDGGGLYLAKLAVASSLCLHSDAHAGNLGVMRDSATGAFSLPPLYDFGGAFGTFDNATVRLAQANPQLAMLFVNWEHRGLDPSWDYTWCDLGPLEGFGQTVEGMLGQCEELAASGYPAYARMLFESQLAYVASVVDR